MVIGADDAVSPRLAGPRRDAIVRAFDTRLEVKQQVEYGCRVPELELRRWSGGGGYAKVMSEEFIEAEMEMFAEQAQDVDIIIPP